jgi:hypothetical protein
MGCERHNVFFVSNSIAVGTGEGRVSRGDSVPISGGAMRVTVGFLIPLGVGKSVAFGASFGGVSVGIVGTELLVIEISLKIFEKGTPQYKSNF